MRITNNLVEIIKGDLLPVLEFEIKVNGVVEPLTDKTAEVIFIDSLGVERIRTVDIFDIQNALVHVTLIAADVETVGDYRLRIRLKDTSDNNKPQTWPTAYSVIFRVLGV